MAQPEIIYLAVVPPKTLEEDVLRRAASLVVKDVSDMRLLLVGKIPRIIAKYQASGPAEAIARGLKDAGLLAFVCRDSELRNRPESFMAHSAAPEGGRVVFRDRPGREARITADEAFLIIRGRLQSVSRKEITTKKRKLNIAATVLTGGLPVMRRTTQTSLQESFQSDEFVRIFDRKTSDPRVEMFRDHIDYAFLGPALTASTPANFEILVAKLREWFPRAIYDERPTRSIQTDIPTADPAEAVNIGCRLIYFGYLAGERQKGER